MIRVTIDKLAYGGAGLAAIDGKRLFVPFAAPGDLADVEIVADHGSYAEAGIIRIVKSSPCRVESRCPVFGQCGGCQWQHISYEAQLAWKKIILVETIERIGKIRSPHVLSALPSPLQWNYRNRVQLHVDSKGRVGFYRPKSKEVVEFERCLIADESLNEMLTVHREEYRRRDRGIGLKLREGPHFSQVNSAQNEQVKGILTEWLQEIPHATIVELYAGSGNFTFPMACVAKKVVALEIDGNAVEHARRHAGDCGISNVTFHRMPAHRARQVFHRGSPDIVFMDPPRKGAAEAIDAIAELAPKAILYMSCDPATMARDVLQLVEHGWHLEKSLPIDMFPQTFHIESLTMFIKT